MNDYKNFVKHTSHFQPRIILEIGGVDVSDRLIQGHLPVTDAVLDTPTFQSYTTNYITFCLDNSDNAFNLNADSNFFTAINKPKNGWQVPVKASVIFENENAPSTAQLFFIAYIDSIVEHPPDVKDDRWVYVRAMDRSGWLRHHVIEDFGRRVTALISGIDVGTKYTELLPAFKLPDNSLPIAHNSFSAGIRDGKKLQILPTLPLAGEYANSDYAALSADGTTGQLILGAAPPDGDKTQIDVGFKTAWRHRTPEALISLLLEESGVFDDLSADELIFAKSLIESPSLIHTRPQWSSHSRPQIGTVNPDTPVVRWIESDADAFYFGGDRKLFKYERRNDTTGVLDEYTELSECPDADGAIIQFTREGSDFYVLTAHNYNGSDTRLYKVTDGTTWSQILNADAETGHFYDYDGVSTIAAENRRNFFVHGDWLYFFYHSGTAGIKRYNTDTGVIETVYSQSAATTNLSWDFIVEDDQLYVFLTQRPDNPSAKTIKMYRMELDGSSVTEVYSDEIAASEPHEPVGISDVVVRNGVFYFVLSWQLDVHQPGFADLCYLPKTGGTRKVLKRYENATLSAHSLVVHDEDGRANIYALEGTQLSRYWRRLGDGRYPNFTNTGHLIRIETDNTLTDVGPVWRSFLSTDGRGEHTCYPSNLWRDDTTDTLHCISGFGEITEPEDNSMQSTDLSETQAPTNFVWLQYGKRLAGKIPVFPTNGKRVWQMLQELAWSVNYEIGFTLGTSELAAYRTANPSAVVTERPYFYFRERSAKTTDIVLDESDILKVQAELDSTLIYNYIEVQLGGGHVWVSKDDVAIEKDGIRGLPLSTGLLNEEAVPWAELIADKVLELQKEPRLIVHIPMKFSPHLELGQRVEITSVWHSLSQHPFKITQIQHDTNNWMTHLEAREILDVDTLLRLPEISNIKLFSGNRLNIELPEATGGTGPYTYRLSGLPDWAGFGGTSGRNLSGTAAISEALLTYHVADSSDPQRTHEVTFLLSVASNTLSFGGATIADMEHTQDESITAVELPQAMGGVLPLTYSLSGLPAGYNFDAINRVLTGTPEAITASPVEVTYTVTDAASPTPATLSLTFDINVTAAPTEIDSEILEWYPIPPIDMFSDAEGVVSGLLIEDIEDWVNNPSGAALSFAVGGRSSALTAATLIENGVSVNATGIAANRLEEYVEVEATGVIAGETRTIATQIPVRLIANPANPITQSVITFSQPPPLIQEVITYTPPPVLTQSIVYAEQPDDLVQNVITYTPPPDLVQSVVTYSAPPTLTQSIVTYSAPPDLTQSVVTYSAPPDLTQNVITYSEPPELVQSVVTYTPPPDLVQNVVTYSEPPELTQVVVTYSEPPDLTQNVITYTPPPDLVQNIVTYSQPPELTQNVVTYSAPPDLTQSVVTYSQPPQLTQSVVTYSQPPDLIQNVITYSQPPDLTQNIVTITQVVVTYSQPPDLIQNVITYSAPPTLTQNVITYSAPPDLTQSIVTYSAPPTLTQNIITYSQPPALTQEVILAEQPDPLEQEVITYSRPPTLRQSIVTYSAPPELTQVVNYAEQPPDLTQNVVTYSQPPTLTQSVVTYSAPPTLTQQINYATQPPDLMQGIQYAEQPEDLVQNVITYSAPPDLVQNVVTYSAPPTLTQSVVTYSAPPTLTQQVVTYSAPPTLNQSIVTYSQPPALTQQINYATQPPDLVQGIQYAEQPEDLVQNVITYSAPPDLVQSVVTYSQPPTLTQSVVTYSDPPNLVQSVVTYSQPPELTQQINYAVQPPDLVQGIQYAEQPDDLVQNVITYSAPPTLTQQVVTYSQPPALTQNVVTYSEPPDLVQNVITYSAPPALTQQINYAEQPDALVQQVITYSTPPTLIQAVVTYSRPPTLRQNVVTYSQPPTLTQSVVTYSSPPTLTQNVVTYSSPPTLTQNVVTYSQPPQLTQGIQYATQPPDLVQGIQYATQPDPLVQAVVTYSQPPTLTQAVVTATQPPTLTQNVVTYSRPPTLTQQVVTYSAPPTLTQEVITYSQPPALTQEVITATPVTITPILVTASPITITPIFGTVPPGQTITATGGISTVPNTDLNELIIDGSTLEDAINALANRVTTLENA